MRFYKDTSGSQTSDKVYIVTSFDAWDSWNVSYHKTKKGAYKWIMAMRYQQWLDCRYLGEYESNYDYCVTEQSLDD